MTWDFTFFSTVFQSYQDDGQMIMKGNGSPFTVEKSKEKIIEWEKNVYTKNVSVSQKPQGRKIKFLCFPTSTLNTQYLKFCSYLLNGFN